MQRKPKSIFPGVRQPVWLTQPSADSDIRLPRGLLLAIGLSLLVHVLLILFLVRQHLLDQNTPIAAQPGPLVVSIAKPAAPHIETPAPMPEPPPKPKPPVVQKAKPKAPSKPRPTIPPAATPPTLTARNEPLPKPAISPTAPVAPPKQAAPKAPTLDPSQFQDMASYVKAMREQRNGAEDEDKEEDIKKANLKQPRSGTNGVFQVPRMETHSAILIFHGWKGDFSYSRNETYEVTAGAGEDIQRAIVRKMIEIIRRYYDGDFNWDSPRMGHVVVLSARLKDNDELEDFLMKEFFIRGIQY